MSSLSVLLRRTWPALAAAVLLLAACSKGRDSNMVFDPTAGHPPSWIESHGSASKSADSDCELCHGADLKGGISRVTCTTASWEGQGCHAAGPGVMHTSGWRSTHPSTEESQAPECAQCHKSKDGTPGCFNNTLCHAQKSPHGGGWRSKHTTTSESKASNCAKCHKSKSGTPGCFNGTLCHAQKGGHEAGWRSSHSSTSQGRASECAKCHRSNSGDPGCFNNTLCHGQKSNHPGGWRSSHQSTSTSKASVCAQCHQSKAGTPGCFNGTLCHGQPGGDGGGHPPDWRTSHQSTSTGQASVCARCHQSSAGDPGCFNNTLCHGQPGGGGGGSNHPADWRISHQSTSTGQASVCAQCHQSSAGTPGCFNNTLCHGQPGGGGGGSNHPADWRRTHRSTPTGQAPVCAQCHQSSAGDPGCFNNTLCHGG